MKKRTLMLCLTLGLTFAGIGSSIPALAEDTEECAIEVIDEEQTDEDDLIPDGITIEDTDDQTDSIETEEEVDTEDEDLLETSKTTIKKIVLSKTSYTYDGKTHKPSVTVTDKNGKKVSSSGYTVTYSGTCKDAGTYTVKVKGKGSYTGTISKTFKIKAVALKSVSLSSSTYTYNGTAQHPTVTVADNNGNKVPTSGYSVSYSGDCIKTGSYTVTIKGKGNYTGTISKTFKITPGSLSDKKLTLAMTSFTYNGTVRHPAVTITDKNGNVIDSSEYTVTYSGSCKDAGTYTVEVTGKNNHTGSVQTNFTINKAKIKHVTLSHSSYSYNGKSHTPSIKVTDENENTVSSSGYKVSYSGKRVNVGASTVTITSKGNYTGTIKKKIIIKPRKTSVTQLATAPKAFTVSWSKKTEQVNGYQLQYATNDSFSDAKTIKITSDTTTSKRISGLKGNKRYYVRVRTYKKTSKNTYYSEWSGAKNIVTESHATGEDVTAYAKSWVGKISYYLGASGNLHVGGSSDCSWFIYHCLKDNGLINSWYKSTVWGSGGVPNTVRINSISEAQPGDVLFWSEGSGSGHVVFYAGNGMAVGCNGSSPTTGQVEYSDYLHPGGGRAPDSIWRLTSLDTRSVKAKAAAAKPTITRITPAKGSITLKWEKRSEMTGYQIQYAKSSSFSSAKTVKISNEKTTTKKITGLTSKKKYYVRIRSYKISNGHTYYSSWSGSKSATAK